MNKEAYQEQIERIYNRKHIDLRIREEIENNPDMRAKRKHGVQLIEEWMAGEYYESKMKRIAQLKDLCLDALVTDIFVGVAYCQRETLFTSVSAQLASRLKFSDKVDAIKTVAELMAILCLTDAFDINKADKYASLTIVSRIPLSQTTINFIEDSEYLPPMVCKPRKITSNYCSGYLTHNESLILGKGNHHDGDLCLDVINKMNQVPLKLTVEFLKTVEEKPTFEIKTQDQQEQWDKFKLQSYRFYSLMVEHGNEFYLTHRVDKRGRIYDSGYHITTQGTSFKKAMIELAEEEMVEGVPVIEAMEQAA